MAGAEDAAQEDRQFIRRCLAGEPDATKEFQVRYGNLIYSYPMRVYRMPAEDAGDFYVFAFDKGRIFRRTQSYAGRTSLQAYLAGFVLDNLVLEWKRGDRDIETVSIETLSELPGAVDEDAADVGQGPSVNEMLAGMDVAKAVVLKLLHIEDCELRVEDLRCLSKMSGRRLPTLLAGIDRLREQVREREARLKRTEDALETAYAWMQLYQRRLRQIAEALANVPPATTAAERLRDERVQLERKLARRHQQRAALLARAHRRKVTAPYKDIAALLNTTVGNVASLILRARKELASKVRRSGWELELGDQHD